MITIIMNHKSLWFLSPWKQFDMTNNLITEINVLQYSCRENDSCSQYICVTHLIWTTQPTAFIP